MLLLGLVMVVGIFANLVAPHDPTDASLRARNLPPVWGEPRTEEKLVMEVPESGQLLYQISLEDAQEIDPSAAVGNHLEVVIREGGALSTSWGLTN